jgi:hypothetical protein
LYFTVFIMLFKCHSVGSEFTKFGYENNIHLMLNNLSKISHYLSNLWTNISGKKWIVYQSKKIQYSVTICIDFTQNRLNNLCLNEYHSYLRFSWNHCNRCLVLAGNDFFRCLSKLTLVCRFPRPDAVKLFTVVIYKCW